VLHGVLVFCTVWCSYRWVV